VIEAQIKIEGGEQLLAEMRALGIRASGALRAGMRAGASIIQQAAEQRAPYRRRPRKATRTRASTKRDVVTVRVMPTRRRWYLRLVETGTKPHLIRARRLVVFEGRSGLIATRVVRHPGTRPRPWLRPAFDAARDQAVVAISRRLREFIEQKRRQIVEEGDA
jgi:HK97 gp10 family phage protein